MRLRDLFRRVPKVSADELREELARQDGRPLVVDVREPKEYRRGHLPGAIHIPLSRLADRAGELDPSRPVVTY